MKNHYIEGFVKRASEYGISPVGAAGLLKAAFLGTHAYGKAPKLTEEDVANLTHSKLEQHVEPAPSPGVIAHIKRNLLTYGLGGVGALAGGAVGGLLGDDARGPSAMLGGIAGAMLGTPADGAKNKVLKAVTEHNNRQQVERLIAHMHKVRAVNSDATTNYNR